MTIFKKSNRKGQSIIEAIVALSILMTALIGIMTLLSRSFFLERVTSDQTKATYLAAEGVEIAKNLIDHDVYQNLATQGAQGGWGTCFSAGDYQLDYQTVNCPPLPNFSPTTPLNFDPATGLYSYSAPDPTVFVRRIRITKPSINEIDVESIITWSTGVVTDQSLDLEDHFYNWRPNQ